MLDLFKKTVHKGLLHFDYQLKKLNRNFDDILLEISQRAKLSGKPITIFDIGANNGSSIKRFKRLFRDPVPEIYSFEPTCRLYDQLLQQFASDQKVHLHNIGVGSECGTLLFREHTSSHGSSSFTPVIQDTRFATRRGISVDTVKEYSVDVVSLDSFLQNFSVKHINLLKIDVQGFEEEVLLGCKDLLAEQRVDIIEVEVIIAPVYDKRVSFYDVEHHLVPHGYRLAALSNDGRFYNLAPFDVLQNPELQFDVIYLSEKVYRDVVNL